MNKIIKSKGSTGSEKHISSVCEKTFLSVWSYPNLYTDEGRRNGKGDGKELCDLLVVFNDDIIIFSDKNIAFNGTNTLKIEWQRWVKRAVLRSATQVYGAEKWILEKPNRIYLDKSCSQRFPLKLPTPDKIRIHRVVVTHNVTEAFQRVIKGRGTLMITPGIEGNAHLEMPFHIGQVNSSKGYIHVFDDITFDIVLRELDTVFDFVTYLIKKELLIMNEKLVSAAGEEELLAYYLRTMDKNDEHAFFEDDDEAALVIGEGFWDGLIKLPQYINGKKGNEISYVWDSLIENFGVHALAGTLQSSKDRDLNETTKALKVMASERRVSRRVLSKGIVEKIENTPVNKSAFRALLSPSMSDVGYAFLLYPKPDDMSGYEEHRKTRQAFLSAYCHALKVKQPQLKIIVGVATEPKGSSGGSEDLVYLNTSNWSEEDMENAKQIRQEARLLLDENVEKSVGREYEFPLIANEESTNKSETYNPLKNKSGFNPIKANKTKKRRKIAKASRKRNRKK